MRSTAALSMAGQSIWVDNITRRMLDSGTLERYIRELSVVGLTSNPTIFEKAVTGSADYDAQIRQLKSAGRTDEDTFFELAISDLTRAADLFKGVHVRTGGVDGWVSLEVSPTLAYDTATTVKVAKALHAKAGRPNLYIKVPGTPEGLPAIEELTAAGIPINVTLLFTREQYLAAAEAYIRGLEKRVAAGQPPVVGGVASMFVSRWEKKTAPSLPANLKNTVGTAMAQRCYRAYVDLCSTDRWLALENRGARPQRFLFASTSTKDPTLRDCMYVEALAAARTVNTMPEETLLAFADHGTVRSVLAPGSDSHEATLSAVEKAGVDLAAAGAALQKEGADSFVASWRTLIAAIESKATTIQSA